MFLSHRQSKVIVEDECGTLLIVNAENNMNGLTGELEKYFYIDFHIPPTLRVNLKSIGNFSKLSELPVEGLREFISWLAHIKVNKDSYLFGFESGAVISVYYEEVFEGSPTYALSYALFYYKSYKEYSKDFNRLMKFDTMYKNKISNKISKLIKGTIEYEDFEDTLFDKIPSRRHQGLVTIFREETFQKFILALQELLV